MSSVPFSRYETLFVSTFDSGRNDVSLLSTAVAVFSTFKWGLLSLYICYESSYREKKLPNKTKRLVILCGSRHGLFLRQVVWQKQTNKRQKRNILVHISIQSNLAAAFSFTEIFIFTFSVAYGSCRCRCHIWSDFTTVPSSFVIPLFSHTLPKQTQKNAFPFYLLNIQLTRKRPMKTFANNSWMGLISFYSWKSS